MSINLAQTLSTQANTLFAVTKLREVQKVAFRVRWPHRAKNFLSEARWLGVNSIIRKKGRFSGWKELCFDRTSPGKPACSLLWLAEINTGVTKRKRATPQGISQWRQNLHLYNFESEKKKTESEKQHSWGILNSRTEFEWNFDFFNAIIYRLFGKATSFIEWQNIWKLTDTNNDF